MVAEATDDTGEHVQVMDNFPTARPEEDQIVYIGKVDQLIRPPRPWADAPRQENNLTGDARTQSEVIEAWIAQILREREMFAKSACQEQPYSQQRAFTLHARFYPFCSKT